MNKQYVGHICILLIFLAFYPSIRKAGIKDVKNFDRPQIYFKLHNFSLYTWF